MQNTEFYRSLLQLTPDWSVAKIETEHSAEAIHVYLAYIGDRAPSPATGELCPIYDYREERHWRHLDTMQYRTYLHARVPRVRLPNGDVATIRVPWADAQSHHTLLFEAMAIEWLQSSKNQSQTARLLRISFDQLHRIMTRAVVRGQARQRAERPTPVTFLSIDEKRYKHGRQYLTIVSNAETGQVLAVSESRSTEAALAALADAVPPAQRASVRAVAMDMAPVYRYPVRALLPQAEIVHDKFHLFQYLTQAIDLTRREEARSQVVLRNTRSLWLQSSDRRRPADDRRFDEINAMNLRTAQAWRVRENFRSMYSHCTTIDDAIHYFTQWKDHAARTMLRSILRVVRLFDKHVHGILNYFRYPITNARAEQLNSKIALLNRVAKGFRSAANIRTAILFFFGNLNLLP